MKFRAKDYILKLKEAQLTQDKNKEIAKSKQTQIAQENAGKNGNTVTIEDQTNSVNADKNSQDIVLSEENQNSAQETLEQALKPEVEKLEVISENSKVDREINSCAFKVEKPKFKGDVRNYVVFRADFKHVVESRYSERDAITILRASLEGRPLELIRGIGCDYKAAWDYLDSIYGDPRFIADTITRDISKFKALQDGEDGRFVNWPIWLTEVTTRLKRLVVLTT